MEMTFFTNRFNHFNENKSNGLYAVCVGAYKDKNKADAIVKELKEKGYTSTYLIIRQYTYLVKYGILKE